MLASVSPPALWPDVSASSSFFCLNSSNVSTSSCVGEEKGRGEGGRREGGEEEGRGKGGGGGEGRRRGGRQEKYHQVK